MTSDETRPDRDALREQINMMLREAALNHGPNPSTVWIDAGTRAAWAVVEPALAQRDAEIERVWRWFETDAAALRRERDEVRRVLAAVEAVCGQIERNAQSWLVGDEDEDAAFTALIHAASRIRAALAGDRP